SHLGDRSLASEPRGGGARRRGTPRLQGKRPHQHGRDRTTLRRGGDGSLPGGPHSPRTTHYWVPTAPREEGATCQSLTPTTSMRSEERRVGKEGRSGWAR